MNKQCFENKLGGKNETGISALSFSAHLSAGFHGDLVIYLRRSKAG